MINTTIPSGITAREDYIDWPESEMFDVDKWNIPEFFDVVVVEDDITTTRLIKAIARRANNFARIKSFKTAEEAIDHVQMLKMRNFAAPDLAIVDVYLRGQKDGIAFCERLNSLFPETTVVVTSSVHPKLFQERVNRLQSKPMFLPKPFTIRQMTSLFERLN